MSPSSRNEYVPTWLLVFVEIPGMGSLEVVRMQRGKHVVSIQATYKYEIGEKRGGMARVPPNAAVAVEIGS